MKRIRLPSGTRYLVIATLVIAFIWLIVLPRLASTKVVRQRVRFLNEKGIDPAAFFYGDHPQAAAWERQAEQASSRVRSPSR